MSKTTTDPIQGELAVLMRRSLEALGYKLLGDLANTPQRWADMMVCELNHCEDFKFTKFPNSFPRVDQMIVESGIPFYSLCAHHVIPFFGVAHVAYIPKDWIAGLSKLARAVEFYSRSLTTQEVITQRVLDLLVRELDPIGAAVTLQGRHLCMEMRGVEKPGTITSTSALSGVIKSSADARAEFYHWVQKGDL